VTSDTSSGRYESSSTWGRLAIALERAEIATSLFALAVAFWRLTRIDPEMWSTAIFFAAFPLLAFFVTTRRVSPLARTVATLYLVALAVGVWIADVDWLPGFTAFHNGDTEIADRFNRLDLPTRRLLTWNGTLATIYMLYGLDSVDNYPALTRTAASHAKPR
jgi:hypothetical protein